MLKTWHSLSRSSNASRVPGRRTPSSPTTFGGLATEPKAMKSPPIVSVWAGLRECSWNVDGHVAMRSTTIAGSKRRRSPSAVAPAATSSSRASASRKFMPISARIRNDASWIDSSSSAETTSVGRTRRRGWR